MPRARAAASSRSSPRSPPCVPARARRGRTATRGTRCASPVTDENFYFVMADRFENGDTANDHGGLTPETGRSPASTRRARGFYHGGDLKGLLHADRLHPRARHRLDLAHAELQEQGRPAGGRQRRLPRLLDHRLHADRPAPRARTPTCARSSTPRTAAG